MDGDGGDGADAERVGRGIVMAGEDRWCAQSDRQCTVRLCLWPAGCRLIAVGAQLAAATACPVAHQLVVVVSSRRELRTVASAPRQCRRGLGMYHGANMAFTEMTSLYEALLQILADSVPSYAQYLELRLCCDPPSYGYVSKWRHAIAVISEVLLSSIEDAAFLSAPKIFVTGNRF